MINIDIVNEVAREMRREAAYNLCSREMFERELVRRVCFEMNPHREVFVPGTEKPELDYLRMVRHSVKSGIPVPMVHVKVEAVNPDGSPGKRYEGRSRTYNRNFWNVIVIANATTPASSASFGAGYLTVKKTNAGLATAGASVGGYGYDFVPSAGLGNSNIGIVVGTSTAAESFEDYVLTAGIASGNGAGQLAYSAATVTVPTYTGGTKTWSCACVRVFNNNSGGTITIAETGIYGNGTAGVIMVCRDKLGSTVPVLDGGQLTVTYTITLTFPA